ncbi:MAG: nascent polypeptide-associated complex protein [Thermoplasmata archaeon]|nr:nascent polypeptide-associated complex protein [Thermoplasmata archaeon]MCJ7562156.1 nascent polypeptide-associated complex protein [Thermoplasmata archaeon]
MFPGGRVNPKQMKAMMKRMGIAQEEISDVQEIIIRTRTKELVFTNAAVTAMTVQGQKTYQIVGEPKERPRTTEAAAAEEKGVPEEDVQLVMGQTGCTASEARKALEECDGAPAEAILKVMSSR